MLRNFKIRTKMLISILSVNLIMFVLIVLVYFRFTKQIVVKETQEKAIERVKGSAHAIDGFFREKAKVVWTFCHDPIVTEWVKNNTQRRIDHSHDEAYQAIIKHFKSMTSNDPDLKSVFLACENTQEYFDHEERDPGEDYYVGQRPWYQETVEGRQPIFDVDYDLLDGKIYVAYQFPIYDENGHTLGVGGIDMTPATIERYITELKIYKESVPFLVGSDGTFLFHPDKDVVLQKKIFDIEDDGDMYQNVQIVGKKMLDGEDGLAEVVYQGKKQYFVYTPVQTLKATLVLAVPFSIINAPLRSLANTSVFFILCTSLFLIIIIVLITNTISKPINTLAHRIVGSAENGDLTLQFDVNSKDEVGELEKGFNIFLSRVHDIILSVKDSILAIAKAAEDIRGTSKKLAIGAEEQHSKVNKVVRGVQDMTEAIGQNSKAAHFTAETSKQAKVNVQEGIEAMQATHQGMEAIVSSSKNTGDVVTNLSGRAGQIGDIIQVIDDIADQTNLLALNAAIEAARAGEQGRGFAVVADEVRKLAERTTKATQEIKETVQAIQGDTQNTAVSMQKALEMVYDGQEATNKIEEALQAIDSSVSRNVELIESIANASQQQSVEAGEILEDVGIIREVAKQGETGSEQMATTAEKLSRQTEILRSLVNRFKLREEVSGSTLLDEKSGKESGKVDDVIEEHGVHCSGMLQDNEMAVHSHD